MPQGDGTGSASGGGAGGGSTGGRSQADAPRAMGVGGHCVCSKCGHRIGHVAGNPCKQQSCPKCGSRMIRE